MKFKIFSSLSILFFSILAARAINVSDCSQLDNIRNDLSANYTLTTDIDCSSISNFNPIRNFTGELDGQDHTISNLNINYPDDNNVGLFGSIRNATIKDLNITSSNVIGYEDVGILAGNASTVQIINVSTAGYIEATNEDAGGLIGYIRGTSIVKNSNSSANVEGSFNEFQPNQDSDTGGLIGDINGDANNTVTLHDCYATGTVNGARHTGGLAGEISFADINNCYATGSVQGKASQNDSLGGLLGEIDNSSVLNSYATGSVNGRNAVGGLIGCMINTDLADSYAENTVTGVNNVGGLVGFVKSDSKISDSHAVSNVIANKFAGGLVGSLANSSIFRSYAEANIATKFSSGGLIGLSNIDDNQYEVKDVYADIELHGDEIIGGLIGEALNITKISNALVYGSISSNTDVDAFVAIAGEDIEVNDSYYDRNLMDINNTSLASSRSTSALYTEINYENWDFNNVWDILEGQDYPILGDVNNPPRAITLSNLSLIENNQVDALISTINVQDADENDTFTCTLESEENNFEISGLNLLAKTSFNFEGITQYNVIISCSDNSGASLTENFIINILNDPSDDTSPATSDRVTFELKSTELNENTPTGSELGMANYESNSNSTLSCTVTGAEQLGFDNDLNLILLVDLDANQTAELNFTISCSIAGVNRLLENYTIDVIGNYEPDVENNVCQSITMLRLLDTNANLTLSRYEVLDAILDIKGYEKSVENAGFDEIIIHQYTQLDLDQDGKITQAEVDQIELELQCEPSYARLISFIETTGLNRDGQYGFKIFARYIRNINSALRQYQISGKLNNKIRTYDYNEDGVLDLNDKKIHKSIISFSILKRFSETEFARRAELKGIGIDIVEVANELGK
jgi:hypothetical protein